MKLNKQQIEALASKIHSEFSSARNEIVRELNKEALPNVLASKEVERFDKLASIIAPLHDLSKEDLDFIYSNISHKIAEYVNYSYGLKHSREKFVDGLVYERVKEITSNLKPVPSYEDIKQSILIATIDASDMESLVESVRKQFS